jgi:hypothetical protein
MRVRFLVSVALLLAALGAAIPAAAQLDPACTAFTGTRLRLRKLDWPLGGQRVLFRGNAPVPADSVFDPAETGIRFLMTDDAATVMADVTIPGDGWVGNRAGGAWSYVDREGLVGGLRRVLIRRSPGSSTVRVYVYGQDMTFAKPVRHVYVHVYLPTEGGGAVCGSRYFHELGCTYRNSGGKLNCH